MVPREGVEEAEALRTGRAPGIVIGLEKPAREMLRPGTVVAVAVLVTVLVTGAVAASVAGVVTAAAAAAPEGKQGAPRTGLSTGL